MRVNTRKGPVFPTDTGIPQPNINTCAALTQNEITDLHRHARSFHSHLSLSHTHTITILWSIYYDYYKPENQMALLVPEDPGFLQPLMQGLWLQASHT